METVKKIMLNKHEVVQAFENGSFELSVKPYEAVQLIHILDTPDALRTKIQFTLGRSSILNYYPIILNGSQSNISLIAIMDDSAQLAIQGAYALCQEQTCSFETKQVHKGISSVSSLIFNGTVSDSAFMNYQGAIAIDKNATKSIAKQENKTLLIGSRARAISIPSLEVQTNDVQCAHGSAVGQLHEESLIYAQSRGLTTAAAARLLIMSFFAQILETMPDENLRTILIQRLVDRALQDQG